MSFDPVVLTSLFNTVGSIANAGIQQLIVSKIIVHKGAIFYHRASEFEFAFLLSLGDEKSRVDNILKKIQSLTKKPVEFENIIEIHGHGLTHAENLVNLGMISVKNGKGKIDFGKILREIKSNIVFIKVRVKIDEELRDHLVTSRIDKTSKYIGDEKIETNIEIALDYANLWKNVFDQFTIRDIDFSFNLDVSPETIVKQIPEKYRKRIISAGKKIKQGEKDAVTFLRIMSECFLSFEKDDKRIQLMNLVSVTPEDKFSIKDVQPTMQSMVIAKVGYPVVLPGSLRIRIGAILEGDDIAIRGKLIIDLKQFSKIINDISKDIQNKTQKLKV